MKFLVDPRRVKKLNEKEIVGSSIVYWMQRDQRVFDNWALLYAQELALYHKKPLIVVFCLPPFFLDATLRQYDFMIKGLQEIEAGLIKLNIPFIVFEGQPDEQLPFFIKKLKSGAVVTDFNPLRIKKNWEKKIAKKLECAFFVVDAHNIVPCWYASPKQEYGAYTLRPKIHKLLPSFLTEIPKICSQDFLLDESCKPVDWGKLYANLKGLRVVNKVPGIKPGARAANKILKNFIIQKLSSYDEDRNDPTIDAQSGLSPYLHFGHISAQRIALVVKQSEVSFRAKSVFLEELIVRKELSDNYCYYNEAYDAVSGFPGWAQETLEKHRVDQRQYHYSRKEFEEAKTHDPLWNAAQSELVIHGRIHGYVRMYWAKKILEWTSAVQDALSIAIYLNDTYALDGCDPNGYVGIAWSLGGVHDRAWFERAVFGKIRYMSYNGCRSKFDVKKYSARFCLA